MNDFSGKTIWITGASSGIGAALARALAARGARMILSARSADKLEAVRQSCSMADEHFCLVMDLADKNSIETAWCHLQEMSVEVDILINNAGMTQRARVVETHMEVYRLLLEVNFLAAVDLTRRVLPQMIERGRGQIVAVSSVMGKFSSPQRSGYAAAKQIIDAMAKGRDEVFPGGKERLGLLLNRISPALLRRVMRKVKVD